MEITARQQEVLDLLDSGKKVREIGEDLGITRNAVYQQIQALKKKGLLKPEYTQTGEIRVPANGLSPLAQPADTAALMRQIDRLTEANAQLASALARLTEPPKRGKNS